MDKEQLRGYTARISQANRSGLVVIVFELFSYSMDMAKKAYDSNDKDLVARHLRKAQECVCELKRNLDFQYEVSHNLASLYRYVNGLLVTAITRRDLSGADEINKVMGSLHSAFEEVARKDTSGAVMENTQQVYAGLTYGKGRLNEVFMNGNEQSRGFMA